MPQVNDFLDDFLTARIGTDILSSQYLAITRPGPQVANELVSSFIFERLVAPAYFVLQ